MTTILNIGELVGIVPEGVLRKQGAEMSETGSIRDAWLRIADDGTILDFGSMSHYRPAADPADRLWPLRTGGAQGPQPDDNGAMVIDAEGGLLMPGFCDSHTHIVYAGSREGEFLDKIEGLSYEEIAARGGGILNSSDLLNATSEDELYSQSMERVEEMMAAGTTAIEIKSGYGLCPEGELKMLRVIKRIRESVPAVVRSTFLGAHAVGRGYTKDAYVQEMIDLMPKAAEYADFVDVFCDTGFFTPDDTARILEAGARYGLKPKIHANELGVSGGVQVGVAHGALSVDHLEQTTDAEIEVLRGTETMPTMLPGSSFFLGIPFARAK
ncbi:MAG: imidazolonepropionase, partial [Bacteroidales bacterium]|nr:imidazolonepropionase [Bacteroidales bacterium]